MVLALLDAGETVVVLDNLSTGFRWAVPAGGDARGRRFRRRSAGRIAVLAEHRVDAIAHFAAKIVVPESVTDPLGYYLNNTAKARSLIDCRGQGRDQALHLLLHRGGLRRTGRQPGDGGH